jgi:hypothetical protein
MHSFYYFLQVDNQSDFYQKYLFEKNILHDLLVFHFNMGGSSCVP